MLGNAAAHSSLRCAWNRVIPRGRQYFTSIRSSIDTLSRYDMKVKHAHRPIRVNNMCGARDSNFSGGRGYGTTQQGGSDGNMVLIVGLGGLGLATFAFVKSGIIPFHEEAAKVDDKRPETGANIEPSTTEDGAQGDQNTKLYDKDTDIPKSEAEESTGKVDTQASNIAASENNVPSNDPSDDNKVGEENPKEAEPQKDNSVDVMEKGASDNESAKQMDENVNAGQKSTAEASNAVKETKDNANVKPKDLPKIPTQAPYVIIGAGAASHAACRSIRKHDPKAKILVIGEEEVLPYMRPPLSKELWFSEDEEAADTLYFKQWNGKRRSVFFEDDTYYVKPQLLPLQENGGVAVLTGHRVVNIDPVTQSVHLKHGQSIQYEKLLLATGGTPKNIDLFEKCSDDLKSKVTLFRTVADYRTLDRLLHTLDSVAIVGGGFLGSELACALGSRGKKKGVQVSQIYHESGNMGKVLPKYLSEWTTKKVQNEGVNVYSNAELVSADLSEDGKVSISLKDGQKVNASHVIVCAGIEPSTELALSAGLEVDPELGGFRVNSELQARSDIWVAGDAACFYDVKLGRRRVEHHDHAVVSGRLAGENMTGGKKSYLHQSMFWSDLGPEVGYEAIGIVDNTLDTVGVWAKATKEDSPKAVVEATDENLRSQTEEDAAVQNESSALISEDIAKPEQEELSEDFGKGVVFYLRDDTVVGILLWNVFNKMPVARKIIRDGKKQGSLVELAKLFNIHEK